MALRGPNIISRQSAMRWHIAANQWHQRTRFKGLMRGRSVGSEVQFLSMLTVKQRRARLRHGVRKIYQFRMRGQYAAPLLFEHSRAAR